MVRTDRGRPISPYGSLCEPRRSRLRSLRRCAAAGIGPAARKVRDVRQSNGGDTGNDETGFFDTRLTRKGAREMRVAFAKTTLVVDEG